MEIMFPESESERDAMEVFLLGPGKDFLVRRYQYEMTNLRRRAIDKALNVDELRFIQGEHSGFDKAMIILERLAKAFAPSQEG